MFEGSGLFEGSAGEDEGSAMEDGGGDEEEDEGAEYFYLEESTGYMTPVLSILSIVHTIISFLCIIGYNCLKVRYEYNHFIEIAFAGGEKVLLTCHFNHDSLNIVTLEECVFSFQ